MNFQTAEFPSTVPDCTMGHSKYTPVSQVVDHWPLMLLKISEFVLLK